jgi:hypothetical protein
VRLHQPVRRSPGDAWRVVSMRLRRPSGNG